MFFIFPGIASIDFMSGLSVNHIFQIKVGIVEDLRQCVFFSCCVDQITLKHDYMVIK